MATKNGTTKKNGKAAAKTTRKSPDARAEELADKAAAFTRRWAGKAFDLVERVKALTSPRAKVSELVETSRTRAKALWTRAMSIRITMDAAA